MSGSQPGRLVGVAFALMFAPFPSVASQGSSDGESAGALPRFDVASVKPTIRGFKALGVHRSPDRVEYANLTLLSILADAFSVRWDQIEGPAWLESDADSFTDPADKYLIEAKFPVGTPARTTRLMLQRLLMERFGLKYHRLRKDLKGYALVVDHGGAKFQLETRPPEKWVSSSGRGLLTGPQTMSDLAMDLTRVLSKPVADETGLQGIFNFKLTWLPDEAPQDQLGPSIFTAVREQLGLSLDARLITQTVIVIDSLSRVPTEN